MDSIVDSIIIKSLFLEAFVGRSDLLRITRLKLTGLGYTYNSKRCLVLVPRLPRLI